MIPIEHRILKVASRFIPRECPVKLLQEQGLTRTPLNLELLIKDDQSYTCHATVTCKQPQEDNATCIACPLRTGKKVEVSQHLN